jgi:hypothetical protein
MLLVRLDPIDDRDPEEEDEDEDDLHLGWLEDDFPDGDMFPRRIDRTGR